MGARQLLADELSGPYRQVFAANTDRAIVQLEADRDFADVSRRASAGVQPRRHVLARTQRSARMEATRPHARPIAPFPNLLQTASMEASVVHVDRTAPLPFAPTTPREDETSVQRGGSARRWSRNHLVDVVGEIAQSKSGTILRPVPTCRNGRYFYCTCHDQRRSDGRSCLNFSRFHFSSLFSPLKPPFRDDDGARIAPSAQTRQSAGVVKVEMARR